MDPLVRLHTLVVRYGDFVAVDNLHLNGRLTLGENTADNGGARIALAALEHMIADGSVCVPMVRPEGMAARQDSSSAPGSESTTEIDPVGISCRGTGSYGGGSSVGSAEVESLSKGLLT